jgi:hypothetical protein
MITKKAGPVQPLIEPCMSQSEIHGGDPARSERREPHAPVDELDALTDALIEAEEITAELAIEALMEAQRAAREAVRLSKERGDA